MRISVCEQCGRQFDARRSTRLYCSESCKQKAKRARERGKRLPLEARCQKCHGPLFPDNPQRYRQGTRGRKYCGHECRNATRRYFYRVALLSETGPNDVTDPYALTDPVPCWRSAEWHEIAGAVIDRMGRGWVLALPTGLLSDGDGWRFVSLDREAGLVEIRHGRYASQVGESQAQPRPVAQADDDAHGDAQQFFGRLFDG